MTVVRTYFPSTDAGLLNWARNFSGMISGAPTDYGLTSAQATAFAALFTAYENAYNIAVTPETRTKGAIAAKNTARKDMKADARNLVSIIQGIPTVTPQMKIDLGITVRDNEPTPIPPPQVAPEMDILNVIGRTVILRLHGGKGNGRRKPDGVKGAAMFSYVGAEPPEDLSAWKFEGNTTKVSKIEVDFPVSVPGDAKV